MNPQPRFSCLTSNLALTLLCSTALHAADWSVPLGGNAYVTSTTPTKDQIQNDLTRISSPDTVVSVYFHVNRSCDIKLGLNAKLTNGQAEISAKSGTNTLNAHINPSPNPSEVSLGALHIDQPGYVRIDLKGVSKTSDLFVEASDLVVHSDTENLEVSYVKSNQGNMFYWGKRGPSVHLTYEMPTKNPIAYSYSELTVQPGEDPSGSYFMANGFGEGYFGIQVKSPTERWVLFSVWSPFQTDHPQEIPENQKIKTLALGEGVKGGAFGGEGSGGQSYLVFPWKSGTTYRFLNHAKPDGNGNTIYSAWFCEAGTNDWKLMARFLRPSTNKNLTGFHSFLENFAPNQGYHMRKCQYGNQWVCDTNGTWFEVTKARFSGDGTASGKHRLDFAGGSANHAFFMKNGGFFPETTKIGESFTRTSTSTQQPQIDFSKLP